MAFFSGPTDLPGDAFERSGEFNEPVVGEYAAETLRYAATIGLFLAHHDDQVVPIEQNAQIFFGYQMSGGIAGVQSILRSSVGIPFRSGDKLGQAVNHAFQRFVSVPDFGSVRNAHPAGFGQGVVRDKVTHVVGISYDEGTRDHLVRTTRSMARAENPGRRNRGDYRIDCVEARAVAAWTQGIE